MTASRGRRRLTLIAVVTLLLADVALVAIAFKGVSGGQPQPRTVSSASVTTRSESTAPGAPTTTAAAKATALPPVPSSPSTGEARPLSQAVVAVNANTAWRQLGGWRQDVAPPQQFLPGTGPSPARRCQRRVRRWCH